MINSSSTQKLNLRNLRQNFTVFQLSLGMKHFKKTILGMAKIFNLGTKKQSLQYRVNAKTAKIQRKKRRKKEEKKNRTARMD